MACCGKKTPSFTVVRTGQQGAKPPAPPALPAISPPNLPMVGADVQQSDLSVGEEGTCPRCGGPTVRKVRYDPRLRRYLPILFCAAKCGGSE